MKKADMNFTFILTVAAVIFIAVAMVAILPRFEPLKDFFKGLGFEMKTEENEEIFRIDEERIDEDTSPILIGYLPYDKESEKIRAIIKNSYGKKWSLIYYKGTERMTEVSEKSLQEVLDSEYTRGSIAVGEKVYIHSPSRNDFKWFEDTKKNYDYDAGEETITTEDLAQLIVADLFEQAKEESS